MPKGSNGFAKCSRRGPVGNAWVLRPYDCTLWGSKVLFGTGLSILLCMRLEAVCRASHIPTPPEGLEDVVRAWVNFWKEFCSHAPKPLCELSQHAVNGCDWRICFIVVCCMFIVEEHCMDTSGLFIFWGALSDWKMSNGQTQLGRIKPFFYDSIFWILVLVASLRPSLSGICFSSSSFFFL